MVTRKTRAVRRQGTRKLAFSVPDAVTKQVSKLLWLDRNPENISVKIVGAPALNVVLQNIMFQLGADYDVLNTKCVAICGPTAVGKTKFINHLKSTFGAETINMDTMQVYRGISYGTGRTNLENTVGSYVYGSYDPNKEFHIVNYLIDVFKAIKQINANGNTPVFEGASKSLLGVINRIFPNLAIYGIRAPNYEKIVERITLRISRQLIADAIVEFGQLLRHKLIKYNSPVITDNWVVYNIIVTNMTRAELVDKDLAAKINSVLSSRIDSITAKCVKANIKLHLMQLKNLEHIPGVKWFTNDDKSIKLLERQYVKFTK